ncbi:MAG: DUF4325 domain-containing protein [Clostridia bacterium]|nr:DUF4325 domain-containing protein [Clostridia bacterium]MBQ9922493.1 DUF4325 domain-containing protein [Clostridia bacterium]
MRFDEQKKQSIILYLLDKIDKKEKSPVQSTVSAFNINKTTVYSYIDELCENKVIKKLGRGSYELITNTAQYKFSRSAGDLDSDTYIFYNCFEKFIKELPSNVYQIWIHAFSEMVNNVMDHSMAENVSIHIEQNILRTAVSIADNGIGIFKKIKDHFGYATLDDAICELFKGKLTTDTENHSGEGIFFSSKMMDRFFIYSDGKIFNTNKYQDSDIKNFDGSFKGTIVFMELSNHTNKQTSDIFDMYADVVGGFKKTKIVLKNIFETSPVSRSQAKRVCNRLDEFEEVIFDFEGIEWMGQGFAHQIFSVFASAHPEIRITAVNMAENVLKMYNHVTQ